MFRVGLFLLVTTLVLTAVLLIAFAYKRKTGSWQKRDARAFILNGAMLLGVLLLSVCCMGNVRPFAEGFGWLTSHPLERFYLLPVGLAGVTWFVVFREERACARKRGRFSAAGLVQLLTLGLCTAFLVFGLLTGFCAPEIFTDGRLQTALMTVFSCLLFYSGLRAYFRSAGLRRREKRPAGAWDRVLALLGVGAMVLGVLLFLFVVWLRLSVVL